MLRGIMKKQKIFFLLFFLVILCSAYGAIILTPKNFHYKGELSGPLERNKLYMFHLDSEVIKKCEYGCKDVRIFNQSNNEIPYVVLDCEKKGRAERSYVFEIVDYAETANIVTLTTKLQKNDKPISSIRLETDGKDFKRDIELYGSMDMKTWNFVGEDVIYDFSSQVDLKKKSIKFKKSRYFYYRIKIIDTELGGDTTDSVKLKYEGLDFSVNKIKTKKLQFKRIVGISQPGIRSVKAYDEYSFTEIKNVFDKDNNSTFTIEANLPIDKVYFNALNPYYFRNVKIYGSDTGEKDSYRLLESSTIYSFNLFGHKEKKAYVSCNFPKCKTYKFVVENGSNPPIDIKSIKFQWVRKNLYFIALNDDLFYLFCCGNTGIEKPYYDLTEFIGQDNWYKYTCHTVELRHFMENKSYIPAVTCTKKAKTEKTILVVIVSILVMGMGIWLYKLLKVTTTIK